MIDNSVIEACYVPLVVIAWAWGLSQLRIAWRVPSLWRWAVATWMLAKAWFLSIAAYTWWFNDFPETAFLVAIVLLTLTHAVAFGIWLRLDDPPPLTPPTTISGYRPRETKYRFWV